MYFDNKEFGSNEFAVPGLDIESGTDFAARLTPRVGIRWDEKNTLVIAADMIKNFRTQESAYLSEIKPRLLLPVPDAQGDGRSRYLHARHDARRRLFDGILLRVGTLLPQPHERRAGAVQRKKELLRRVRLRLGGHVFHPLARKVPGILLAGRHYLDTFYYGFNYSMFHYAGQQGAPIENVVDLQLLNPCVGVRFNAFFDFDIKLGALLTAQRDRSFGHSWEKPCMGEFAFRISRWGLSLDERLYVGDNIHPFFYGHELEDGTPLPYGRELYPAESFFRTDQKVYSRTALSYRRSFFNDTVSVRAEFAAHHDGTALGTQQMLVVGVKLLKTVYNSKNHKK